MNPVSGFGSGLDPKRRALFEKLLRQEKAGSASTSTIVRRPASGSVPASFAQGRLWFFDQLEPNSALYNIPMALHLDGLLDPAVLQRSLDEVVRRHEALRTCFKTVAGEPMQVIEAIYCLEIPFIDLSKLPEHERSAEAMRLCGEEAQRPFDLRQPLLLRARLFRLEPRQHLLFLNLHHIIADGWSIGVLLRELGSLYEAFSKGQPSQLAELPIQYADFAVWQRDWLQGEVLEKLLGYWRKQLKGAPALLELPIARSRPALQSYRGARETALFPLSLLRALEALSREEGASLFMTLLAAFQTLLCRYSGQEDITVGSPIAGHNRMEVEGLIGLFVNTLVLRGDLSGNPTFRELLRRVREMTLAAYAHQELPFEKLVEELQPDRSLSHSPLYQVFFALQNTAEPAKLDELNLSLEIIFTGTSKLDLSVDMSEGPDGLKAVVEYCTDLFSREAILRLLNHFRVLLEGIVANPDQQITILPLLTTAERHQLLVEWNQTAAHYPRGKCLHELFEAQVERTPDAVAVTFEKQHLTYRELNERANQLAHHLRRLGVGPDVLVPICAERSLEMVVGLISILKAGGAYVPIDPSYPAERVAFMLRDAAPSVVLAQAKLLDTLPLPNGAVAVNLDSGDWSRSTGNADNPARTATDANLAYVIYTSGSTGTPKGAMIPHRAIVNHIRWMQSTFPMDERDRVLQKTEFSFDVSVWEFFAPLATGARLIMARPGTPGPSLFGGNDRSTPSQCPATRAVVAADASGDARIQGLPQPAARLLRRRSSAWRCRSSFFCNSAGATP